MTAIPPALGHARRLRPHLRRLLDCRAGSLRHDGQRRQPPAADDDAGGGGGRGHDRHDRRRVRPFGRVHRLARRGARLRARWAPAGPSRLAIAAGLCSGAAAGLANGVLVARYAVPSFVATLATGTILSGFAYWASGGASLFSGVPEGFKALGRGDLLGVPVLAWWMAAVLGISALVLARTRFGRRLYAIGDNREAARLSRPAGMARSYDGLRGRRLAVRARRAAARRKARLGPAHHGRGHAAAGLCRGVPRHHRLAHRNGQHSPARCSASPSPACSSTGSPFSAPSPSCSAW